MKLRPEDNARESCDAVGCPRTWETRYRAGADEHLARARDVRLCDRHLAAYQTELERVRAGARASITAAGASARAADVGA